MSSCPKRSSAIWTAAFQSAGAVTSRRRKWAVWPAALEAELGVALFVRTGRRLELADAGRLLRPEAERTLAAASDASDVVRRARTLTGGTASLGTFSTAHHLLLPRLVEDFARRHPQVAVRVVGENSSQLADDVRAGRLEAGLVALPIDDDRLEVGAAVAQFEVVYATANREGLSGPIASSSSRRASWCCA
jgi:LysR family cyn operon transcriptional activator